MQMNLGSGQWTRFGAMASRAGAAVELRGALMDGDLDRSGVQGSERPRRVTTRLRLTARTAAETAASTPREMVRSDALRAMANIQAGSIDVICTDPPYFLSSGGSTCRSGKRASVNKGDWDKPTTPESQLEWTRRWLALARRLLKPTGSIWISGTMHSTSTSGYALQLERFRILNTIAWTKPNPPPNLGCRCFTHAHETLIWASLGDKSRHYFDYEWTKSVKGKQMKDVWEFPAPPACEKTLGKHPTQKPVALVERCLMASCPEGGLVLDPFAGSGTTGVAAIRRGFGFIGIEQDPVWCNLARERIAHEVSNAQL